MKNQTILVSVFFILLAALGIWGTQFLTSGSNPGNLIMFMLLMLIGQSAENIALVGFHNPLLRFLPLAITAVIAAWGTWLFLCADSWKYATSADLICDYYAPMFGSLESVLFAKLFPSKH